MAIKAHRLVQCLAGKGLVLGGAIALGLALVSCAPSYSYIADSGGHTYFKVPWGWKQIGASQLCNTIASSNTRGCLSNWVTAYEPASNPVASDFGSWTLAKPFVFAQVSAYDATQNGPITDDTLRDIFLPVTASAQSADAAQNLVVNGFRSLRDATLTLSGGFHGVRETFEMGINGSPVDTFDQVALVDAGGDTVYLIVAHCTTRCYSQDQTAINDVISSFTVRSH